MKSMPWSFALFAGAAFGFIGVGLGAFGAHGLKSVLSDPDLEIVRLAAHYILVHAVALVALSGVQATRPGRWLSRAAVFWVAGTIVFAGSLLLLVGSGARWWGAVTPLGGTSLLIGWACVAAAALKQGAYSPHS